MRNAGVFYALGIFLNLILAACYSFDKRDRQEIREMSAAIIIATMGSAFALIIIAKHIKDLLDQREQTLMAYKRIRMRQELVQFIHAPR